MRILTLRQPWASAVFLFGKNVENRSWDTQYRGRLVIHAGGSRFDDSFWHSTEWEKLRELTPVCSLASMVKAVTTYGTPRSAVLGEVELRDVRRAAHTGTVRHNIWANHGRLHWLLHEPRLYRSPIPAAGKLQLWRPSELLAAAIERSAKSSECIDEGQFGWPSDSARRKRA